MLLKSSFHVQALRFWSPVMEGFNHLTMSRLNLKFKIGTAILVANYWGSIILPCPGLNLSLKFFTQILVANYGWGSQSFLTLVHHPNLQLPVSAGHHRGFSHERPIKGIMTKMTFGSHGSVEVLTKI